MLVLLFFLNINKRTIFKANIYLQNLTIYSFWRAGKDMLVHKYFYVYVGFNGTSVYNIRFWEISVRR